MNSLLGSLAEERRLRQEAKKTQDQPPLPPPPPLTDSTTNSKKNKKKKKKKPKARDDQQSKLEGLIKESDKELDDDAFLDQQVQRVATSHGRVVQVSNRRS